MISSAVSLGISACLIILTAFVGMLVPLEIESRGGALVVDVGSPMFQMNGIIFGGYSDHEYGHYLQQRDMTREEYLLTVAVPSVSANVVGVSYYLITGDHIGPDASNEEYRSRPWEGDADLRADRFFGRLSETTGALPHVNEE